MDDLHFMERLERVAWRETELALRLYREPGMVRLLLDDAKAPEAPRIAVALAAGPTPPHVIVARDGAFVTCLGAGMSVGDMPVVPHHRIAVAADRHEALKGKIAYIDWAIDNAGSVRRLWRSVLNDGHRVPREVILALMPLVNVFGPLLTDTWLREDQTSRQLVYDNTNRFTRPGLRPTSGDVDVLERIWRGHWAVGHVVSLFGLNDRPLLDGVGAVLGSGETPQLAAFQPMRFGFWATTLRGAWLAARIGPSQLRAAKAILRGDSDVPALKAGAALVAAFVGASSSKHRAEAYKALAPGPKRPDEVTFAEAIAASLAFGLTPEVLTDHAGGRARLTEEAQSIAAQRDETFDPEMVDLLAYTTAGMQLNLYRDRDLLSVIPGHLGWLARADLPEFYPKEAWLRSIPPWRPADTVRLITDAVGLGTWRTGPPAPKPPRPGRNAPCPCGSERKFKRCCGA